MWMAVLFGMCFLNLLNFLHHWLLWPFFFLPINNIFCFSWLSIFEHLFFSYFISCGKINIHHIHICNDYLCLSNMLNLYYCQKFPMKHLLHLNKLWIICHFMSIQTTNVVCIWRCLLLFLLGCATSMVATVVYYFLLLHVSMLWYVIPQFVQCLLVFLVLLCVFVGATCFILYGAQSELLASVVVMPSSHNIATSLCYCNVDYFILVVIIMRYDCKLVLNTTIKKLFVVGIYKPWTNFWICSW